MQAGETLSQVWAALTRASALAELGVLLACVVLAWGMVRIARRFAPASAWVARTSVGGVMFPLFALVLVVAARAALAHVMPIGLLLPGGADPRQSGDHPHAGPGASRRLPRFAAGADLLAHAVLGGVAWHGAVGHRPAADPARHDGGNALEDRWQQCHVAGDHPGRADGADRAGARDVVVGRDRDEVDAGRTRQHVGAQDRRQRDTSAAAADRHPRGVVRGGHSADGALGVGWRGWRRHRLRPAEARRQLCDRVS